MVLLESFWQTQSTTEAIFLWIAIPATGILAILLLLSFFGGDFDGDTDFDTDLDNAMGFQFITFKNLVGFFAVFGWTGRTCLQAQLSPGVSIVIAIVAGLAMMTILATIFYFMSKLTEDGTLKIENAKGGIGEVYLTIPPRRTGYGKVQIRVQGTLRELDAISDSDAPIPTGKLITVTDIISGEILLVTENK